MAYKDSGEIATNSNYTLGDYSFRIERTSVPGSANDKIEAICTDKDGKNARKSIQLPSSTNLDGWYVEANGDTADVYVLVQTPEGASGGLLPAGVSVPIVSEAIADYEAIDPREGANWFLGYSGVTGGLCNGRIVLASTSHIQVSRSQVMLNYVGGGFEYLYWPGTSDLRGTFTYDDKTVWYTTLAVPNTINPPQPFYGVQVLPISTIMIDAGWDEIAWSIVYGTISDGNPKEVLIGRFEIDLEDAGGVGLGSDWTDPGDYDPDWEEGDPTHTLYVEVTGALSGRHNDPIEDPSYSYIPADKDTVKDYGCGGDGGHGGGGGAGASTVVIHKFATNQANSKEVTAIARRHGYGSGGGKGGKGGDGCILVYY